MKRLLTSLVAAVTFAMVSHAGEVTFDFVNESYGLTRYSSDAGSYISSGTVCALDGVEIYFSKVIGKTGFKLWTDGLRFYRNSSARIYVSAPGAILERVAIEGDTGADFSLDPVSVSSGSMLSNVWTAASTSAADGVEEICLSYEGEGTYAVHTITVSFVREGEGEGEGEAALPEIDADEQLPEYFTLQGIKVDSHNLSPGLSLRRVGRKVTKIAVR